MPSFLSAAAPALSRSGRQMRLLAALPERLAGGLLPQLLSSVRSECAAAAAAAAGDPWAGAHDDTILTTLSSPPAELDNVSVGVCGPPCVLSPELFTWGGKKRTPRLADGLPESVRTAAGSGGSCQPWLAAAGAVQPQYPLPFTAAAVAQVIIAPLRYPFYTIFSGPENLPWRSQVRLVLCRQWCTSGQAAMLEPENGPQPSKLYRSDTNRNAD